MTHTEVDLLPDAKEYAETVIFAEELPAQVRDGWYYVRDAHPQGDDRRRVVIRRDIRVQNGR